MLHKIKLLGPDEPTEIREEVIDELREKIEEENTKGFISLDKEIDKLIERLNEVDEINMVKDEIYMAKYEQEGYEIEPLDDETRAVMNRLTKEAIKYEYIREEVREEIREEVIDELREEIVVQVVEEMQLLRNEYDKAMCLIVDLRKDYDNAIRQIVKIREEYEAKAKLEREHFNSEMARRTRRLLLGIEEISNDPKKG